MTIDYRYLVFSPQSASVRGSVWEFDLREMNVLKTQSLLKDILAFSLIFGQDYFCLHLLLWRVIWNGKFRQKLVTKSEPEQYLDLSGREIHSGGEWGGLRENKRNEVNLPLARPKYPIKTTATVRDLILKLIFWWLCGTFCRKYYVFWCFEMLAVAVSFSKSSSSKKPKK